MTEKNKKALMVFPAKYWLLIALAILFIGPFVAAWSFYTSGDNWVPETMNYGHLIEPPVAIKLLNMRRPDGSNLNRKNILGKWTLLYIEPNTCNATCKKTLYKMRQVRLALGNDMTRVRRVVATFPDQMPVELDKLISYQYAGTHHYIISKTNYLKMYEKLSNQTSLAPAGNLYIVDPLGNIMMSYQTTIKTNGIYKDLKRLLQVSQIG